MFTTGQLIFAILFAITFLLIIILSYKKDRKIHLKNYKGVIWVAIAFAIFLIFLVSIKFLLKN